MRNPRQREGDPSQSGGNPPEDNSRIPSPQPPPSSGGESPTPQQNQQNTQPQVTYGGSPVSSNGKIAPPSGYNAGAVGTNYQANPDAYRNIKTPDAYKAGTVTQFQNPNHQKANDLQMSLIEQILANPRTLDEAAIAKLREKQKDSSLAFAQQMREGMAGDFASRGVQGGQRQAFDMMVNDALTEKLLTGYRDIDIAALATNRQDELNALQSSEALLGGQTGRSTALYEALRSGQMSQEQLNIEAVRSALEAAGFDLSKVSAAQDDIYREAQYALEKYKAEEEARFRQAQLEQMEWAELLDEAFRRDELNADDRFRYTQI